MPYCLRSQLQNLRSVHISVLFYGIEVLDVSLGAMVTLSGHPACLY
jgi:hypothetical protein